MSQESLLIWGGALFLVALIVGPYLWAFRRQSRLATEQLSEARRLGIDQPPGEFPYIDPSVCIGCGGCVKACPEGDVLGLIGGLATVVNGARCIGIGQCEKVCPVNAIEMRVGEMKGRSDVPVMDDEHQTNVPGIYVVGELGGLALIRHAVLQGAEAIRRLAAEPAASESDSEGSVDVAVVGAGPSGLSAALAAREAGLSCVVLEQEPDLGGTIYHYPRRKLTHTQPVELPLYGTLKREEYTKEELLELFQELVDSHGVDIRFGERVEDIERRDGGGFRLRTTAGEHRSRRVLLALGRRGTPRKLGVPGEEQAKVMYQLRDAELYRRQRVLCVGGGDSAVEAAMGLARQPGNEVAISYRKEAFFRIKKKIRDRLDKLVKRRKIRLLMQSQVLEIGEQSVRLELDDEEIELPNDYVFVMIGGIPPFPLLRQIGVRFGGDSEDETEEVQVLGGALAPVDEPSPARS